MCVKRFSARSISTSLSAQLDDGLMEFDVDVGIFVEMRAQFAVLESGEHLAQSGDLFVRRCLRDQPRRHAFQRRPGGDHFDHLALRLAHHVDAAAWHRAHKALAFELGHRLTHRRAADAEVLRQFSLVQPDLVAIAIDVHRHDRVLQRRIGLLLEAWRDVDRLQRRVRRERRARGSCATGQANTMGFTVSLMAGIQYARSRGYAAITLILRAPESGEVGLFRRPQLAVTHADPGGLDEGPEQRNEPQSHDRADQPGREEHTKPALRGEKRLTE